MEAMYEDLMIFLTTYSAGYTPHSEGFTFVRQGVYSELLKSQVHLTVSPSFPFKDAAVFFTRRYNAKGALISSQGILRPQHSLVAYIAKTTMGLPQCQSEGTCSCLLLR